MADITITPERVRFVDPSQRHTTNAIANEAVTRGQVVYERSDGRVGLARGNAVNTAKPAGVATNDAKVGEPVTIAQSAMLVGYGLDSVNNGATVFLSAATAGAVADAAASGTGNVAVPLGQVKTATGSGRFKYILFDISAAFVPVALP